MRKSGFVPRETSNRSHSAKQHMAIILRGKRVVTKFGRVQRGKAPPPHDHHPWKDRLRRSQLGKRRKTISHPGNMAGSRVSTTEAYLVECCQLFRTVSESKGRTNAKDYQRCGHKITEGM